MIPLRSSLGVRHFPWSTLLLLIGLCGLEFLRFLRVFEGFVWFQFPNLVALALSSIFMWALLPRVFQRWWSIAVMLWGVLSGVVSYELYFRFFAHEASGFWWYGRPLAEGGATAWGLIPVICAWVAMAVVSEWGSSLTSWGFGPSGVGVYDVPVLVVWFFWFVVLLILALVIGDPVTTQPAPFFVVFAASVFGAIGAGFFSWLAGLKRQRTDTFL